MKSKDLTRIKINTLSSLIIVLFYLCYFLELILDYTILDIIVFLLGYSSLIISYMGRKKDNQGTMYIISMMLLMFISGLFTGNSTIFGILRNFQFLLISHLVINNKLNFKIFAFSFYSYVIFFLANMVGGINPQDVFIGSSRNYISVIIIAQVTFFYIAMYQNNKEIKLLPAFFTLLISVWGVGRTGIISSSFLFVGVLTLYIKQKKIKINSLILYIFGSMVVPFFIYWMISGTFGIMQSIQSALFKLQDISLSNDPRGEILDNYVYNIKNFPEFMFGKSLHTIPIVVQFNLNVHNSFISLHANYGILGFIMIFVGITMRIINFMKTKNYLYFILLCTVIVRAFTDSMAFPGIYESLFLYFIFNNRELSDSKKISC